MQLIPKSIDFPMIKVLKGDEEQYLEQMLIMTFINMQLEYVKKSLKSQNITVPDFKFP